MSWLREIVLRLQAALGKRHKDAALDEELATHLALLIEQNIERGMSPETALREAKLSLGGADQIKELVRDHRGLPPLESLCQDIRFALRMLRKSPGFTTVAVLTLALGIGATSSIFSVVKAVILNPLPFHQPQNLVHVWESDRTERYRPGDLAYFSTVQPGVFYDWQAQTQSFERIAAYHWQSMLFGNEKQAQLVDAQNVTDGFFDMLGVPTELGRTFETADYAPDALPIAILSHRMWVQQFAADPKILGQRISLDRQSYEIVGVMPAGFYPTPWGYPELWTPHWATDKEKHDRRTWGWFVIARLKPNITWEQAQTELDVVAARMAKERPAEQEVAAAVVPMYWQLIGSSWKLLLLLSGAVVLLLLIACVNVANLVLARVLDREKEFSLRSALGARRARLVAQLFTESLILSLTAGLAGIAIASAGTQALLNLLPASANLPRLDSVKVDSGVLLFVFGLALTMSVLCSLTPLLRVSRTQAYEILKSESRSASAGKGKRRLGRAFVLSEFVFSLVLLIFGALLVTNFIQLEHVDPGFDAHNLLTFRITVPEVSYGKFVYGNQDLLREKLYQQLEQALTAVPGVESVALTGRLPLAHEFNPSPVFIEGRELPAQPQGTSVLGKGSLGDTAIEGVNPQFFRALRLRLVSGRFLEERDNANAPLATVVNETFVHTFFPHENPIGKRVTAWYAKATIVGVVSDFKENGIDRMPYPEMFLSLRQDASPNVWVMARTKFDPAALSAALRSAIRKVDSGLPIADVHPMEYVISESLWLQRVSADLIGMLAVLAIILAGAGIYSVMSYSVSQRTREVGIRMALGGTRHNVLRLILNDTCRISVLGCVLGCAAALILGRLVTNQVYIAPQLAPSRIQTNALHPVVFLITSFFLCLVALTASYIPARRAMKVDPMVALRYE